MKRLGRVIRLKDGVELEYERLHKAVWPEVLAAIQSTGIRNYSIFRYQSWLFSYFELPDEIAFEQIGGVFESSPECVRWERLMQTLQAPLSASDVGARWALMNEVFHFEGG